MGVVYRALDTKLNRVVAVKFLSDQVADASARRRFQREAQAVSSLNHPHILTVYDVGELGDRQYLVTEFVDAGTLAEWARKERRSWRQVGQLLVGVADGLAAAHDAGILHRDVKPANILVATSGYAKLADFGLAKRTEGPEGTAGDVPRTESVTRRGTMLGTIAYMSPEHASGKTIDARSDIFSFGVVLYELLAGRRPFEAGSDLDVLHAILHHTPQPLSRDIPQALRMMVEKALEKDPADRYQSMRELVVDLRRVLRHHAADAPTGALVEMDVVVPTAGASTKSVRGVWRWVLASAAALAVAAGAVTLWLQPRPRPEVVRFEIHAPPGSRLPLGTPAISADGRTLAYTVVGPDGIRLIHLRQIGSTESRPLPGTENAVHPFWSPDGRSLAFAAPRDAQAGGSMLKRIDVAGGPARELTPSTAAWHASWSRFGELLFPNARELPGRAPEAGVFRMLAEGGTSTPAIEHNEKEAENYSDSPAFLPDGRRFLVNIGYAGGRRAIHLASLDSPERKIVLDNLFSAALVAPTPEGKTYLLYLRNRALVAHEFDEGAGSVRGSARVIVADIGRVGTPAIIPALGVSSSGAIAYQTGGESGDSRSSWLDRSGMRIEELSPEASGNRPSVSPDGRWLAVDASRRGNVDVWVTDLDRGVTTRLTSSEGSEWSAVWSPDGQRLAYRRDPAPKIYVKRVDGSAEETVLVEVSGLPRSWSPDGQHLLYETPSGRLFVVPLVGAQTPIAVGLPTATSKQGQFSPDGRYIAYTTDESGRGEIFVQPLPPGPRRQRVSRDGGAQPRWSRTTGELFFVSPDGTMMAVEVRAGQTFSAGEPRKLFQVGSTLDNFSYDVSADGQRFLVTQPRGDIQDLPITVVLNWWAELTDR
jgi:eukaryotic-like serine/threonine-protein kinase